MGDGLSMKRGGLLRMLGSLPFIGMLSPQATRIEAVIQDAFGNVVDRYSYSPNAAKILFEEIRERMFSMDAGFTARFSAPIDGVSRLTRIGHGLEWGRH